MPKTTFFNLNDEKRQKIERAAIHEFSAYGLHGARLNNIVKGAEIAKGSFYQYFEDMEDLFFHLMESLGKQKVSFINAELSKYEGADFFTKIKITVNSGIQFYHNLSEETRRLTEQLPPSKDQDSDPLGGIRKRSEGNLFNPLIDEAVAKGEITVNKEFAYAIIANTGRIIRQYLTGIRHTENINEVFKDDKEIEKAVDLFMDFIKKGFGPAE